MADVGAAGALPVAKVPRVGQRVGAGIGRRGREAREEVALITGVGNRHGRDRRGNVGHRDRKFPGGVSVEVAVIDRQRYGIGTAVGVGVRGLLVGGLGAVTKLPEVGMSVGGARVRYGGAEIDRLPFHFGARYQVANDGCGIGHRYVHGKPRVRRFRARFGRQAISAALGITLLVAVVGNAVIRIAPVQVAPGPIIVEVTAVPAVQVTCDIAIPGVVVVDPTISTLIAITRYLSAKRISMVVGLLISAAETRIIAFRNCRIVALAVDRGITAMSAVGVSVHNAGLNAHSLPVTVIVDNVHIDEVSPVVPEGMRYLVPHFAGRAVEVVPYVIEFVVDPHIAAHGLEIEIFAFLALGVSLGGRAGVVTHPRIRVVLPAPHSGRKGSIAIGQSGIDISDGKLS